MSTFPSSTWHRSWRVMRSRVAALARLRSTTPAARSDSSQSWAMAFAETLIDEARDATLRFFRLPLEEKLRTPRPSHESGRGYTAFCDQALAYSLGVETPPDLQESYRRRTARRAAGRFLLLRTRGLDFLRPQHLAHESGRIPARAQPSTSRRIDVLSRRLMGLFALALGLDQRFFDDKVDRPVSSMRAVHYPPSAGRRPGRANCVPARTPTTDRSPFCRPTTIRVVCK